MIVSARDEWSRNWALPFVGMLGVAGSTLLPSANGILLEPLTHEFGWSKSQFSFAYLIQVIVGLATTPLAGRLIDRYGSRRVLLSGLPLAAVGMAMVSLVTSHVWTWVLLTVCQGLTMALVLPLGWMSAVISRFDAARGMALAITLAGVGFGAALWPVLGAQVMSWLGWRAVVPVLGVGWALLLLPIAALLLPREPFLAPADEAKGRGLSWLGPILRSRSLLLLIAAGSLFIGVVHGFNLHLIALLRTLGYGKVAAAGVTSLAGVFAIVGRLGAGMLLDRYSSKPLAIGVFLVPIVASVLLLLTTTTGWMPVTAIVLLGLSLGAESDIIAYVASREFDRRAFASAYGVVSAAFALSAGSGPLLVSMLYDVSGSYEPFLIVACPVLLIGAGLIGLVQMPGRPQRSEGG
ncbi:MFS transporter [Novosphingobium sp. G106]|uniref:MFS transporter n=1 Tax=Novosphingobium sp. G106 TaxID=2849500 RepID=UPI001C2DDFC7|nr:MFS transporter [Novosphingobium sp. G106]MBV1686459.1 MFS transporter [Novosphingobium sp. G106]